MFKDSTVKSDLTLIKDKIEQDPNFNHLREVGRNYVPGSGKLDSPDIMFVGEAPGSMENATRVVFKGKAGKIFNDTLATIGYTRNDVYVTNVLKYMPVDSTGRIRKPTPEEISASREYLGQEIMVINPKVVCLLGATALTAIFPNYTSISKYRGNFMLDSAGFTYIATYHPSFFQYPGNEKYKPKIVRDFETLVNYVKHGTIINDNTA